MDASLDTNVIIDLYKANLQSILFNRFEKLKVYEFIREQELKKHADNEILKLFDKDVDEGKIELITEDYLKKIGMHSSFMFYVNDQKILYEGSDLGEVYAIALAKTLGCICLVTDDIKERGPHYTLMRTIDSDVIPLAFYEILLLDYLEGTLTEEELLNLFNTINDLSNLKMNFYSKLKNFIKRFWRDPYTESEKEWMQNFCKANNLKPMEKINRLWAYIKKNG